MSSMLYVDGSKTSFRCECGANVFTHIPPAQVMVELGYTKPATVQYFECNGCRTWWAGEDGEFEIVEPVATASEWAWW